MGLIVILEHDLVYIGFKEGFKSRGCFICNIVYDYTIHYLDTLLYENVNSITTRKKIYDSLGFCNRHAWLLKAIETSRYRDTMGESIIYAGLAEKIIHDIEKVQVKEKSIIANFKKKEKLRGKHFARKLSPINSCYVCTNEEENAKRYLDYFSINFNEPEIMDFYLNSDGLCYRHFLNLLPLLGDEEALKMLDIYKDRLSGIVPNLHEYLRKMDYRYSSEPKGKEQFACTEAINLISGNDSSYGRLKNDDKDCNSGTK